MVHREADRGCGLIDRPTLGIHVLRRCGIARRKYIEENTYFLWKCAHAATTINGNELLTTFLSLFTGTIRATEIQESMIKSFALHASYPVTIFFSYVARM